MATGSSPAWRVLAETSQDCQLFPRRLSGKRLELLKEIIPKLSRVAVLGTSTNASTAQMLRETELAAGALGVKLQYLDVRGPKDIEAAFRAASKGRADAVLLLGGPVIASQRTQIEELAVKSRLPAIYEADSECGGRGAYVLRREHYRLVPGAPLRMWTRF